MSINTLRKSSTGVELDCTTHKNLIRIVDHSTNAGLFASVTDFGVMRASLYTVLGNGTKHPDLFAAKFLAFALHNFEKQGIEVKKFRSDWVPTSVNFREFKDTLKSTGNKVQAAKSTTTFRMIAPLGFTEISDEVIWDEPEQVIAVFSRIKQPFIQDPI